MDGDAIVPAPIARAERHDPERVIAAFEPLVLERRRERLRRVLEQRLASVTVVLDRISDPHNGSAIMRTCEAFGVQRLHLVEHDTPFLASRRVARSSGQWLDVLRWRDAGPLTQELAAGGFELVATHPDGELLPEDLASMAKVALVMGNEHEGIGEALTRACRRAVRVPMRGMVESLNVSVTAAILLEAATRRRDGDLSERDRRRLYARGLYLSTRRAEDVLAVAEGRAPRRV